MQKRDDSLRSLGKTVLAVDVPLRADIKAMAAKKGLTMVDYLRMKVEEDKRANPQAILSPSVSPRWNPGVGVKNLQDVSVANTAYMVSVLYSMLGGEDFVKALSLPVQEFKSVLRKAIDKDESQESAHQGELKIA